MASYVSPDVREKFETLSIPKGTNNTVLTDILVSNNKMAHTF